MRAVIQYHSPVDKHSRNFEQCARLAIIGAKNMLSSSGWEITNSTRLEGLALIRLGIRQKEYLTLFVTKEACFCPKRIRSIDIKTQVKGTKVHSIIKSAMTLDLLRIRDVAVWIVKERYICKLVSSSLLPTHLRKCCCLDNCGSLSLFFIWRCF